MVSSILDMVFGVSYRVVRGCWILSTIYRHIMVPYSGNLR